MQDDWPFRDPPNTASISTRNVVRSHAPVVTVVHDEDDGTWQFLDGGAPDPADAMVVGLSMVVTLDPGLRELADLPAGWGARRSRVGMPWERSPLPRRANAD